jgi:hypothetical protein
MHGNIESGSFGHAGNGRMLSDCLPKAKNVIATPPNPMEEMAQVCQGPVDDLRSLNEPDTFLVNVAANGFAPGEALALYQEKRLFQQHTLLAWDLVEPRWFTEAREELAHIRSPLEWRLYSERWPALMEKVYQTRNACPWAATVHSLLAYPTRWEEDIGLPLSFDRRYKRETAIPAPPHWGMPWTWQQVHKVIAKDLLPLPSPHRPMPRRWTDSVGVACLRRQLERLGLSGLQWPWARQAVAQTTWLIFCQLRELQQGLGKITRWTGPLLGLGRGLWLRLGIDSGDNGGGYACHDYGLPHICASWTDWPIILSHEWMHMFDAWLRRESGQAWSSFGLSSMAQVPHPTIMKLLTCLKACDQMPLDNYAWLKDWREQINMWRPRACTAAHAWAKAANEANTWSFRSYCRQGFFETGRVVQRRRKLAIAIEPRLTAWANEKHQSLSWWERCDLMEADEKRWMVQECDRVSSWWSEACERLAVAFEGHVLAMHSHQVWYMPGLPTPVERTWHRPYWDAFFEELSPIWETSRQEMASGTLRRDTETRQRQHSGVELQAQAQEQEAHLPDIEDDDIETPEHLLMEEECD